jgi:hypothetical protein
MRRPGHPGRLHAGAPEPRGSGLRKEKGRREAFRGVLITLSFCWRYRAKSAQINPNFDGIKYLST